MPIKYRILALPIILFMVGWFGTMQADASNEPYTIDQAPTTPPSFDGYTVIPVTTLAELAGPVYNSGQTKVIYELQNDITMTGQILVNGDKAINLNGHTLNAGTGGYFLLANGSTTNQFKIYNGTIKGGPNDTSPSGYGTSTPKSAFLNAHYSKKANIVVEDISYTSNTTGGNFIDAIASNVYSLGTVDVNTFGQNIRAGNMTFLGDFTGNSFGNGTPNDQGNGNGGVNLSFAGYAYSYINASNNGNTVMTQTVGDRRMYVSKDSHVVLSNTNNANNASAYLAYANNIGNFAVINVDGHLEATSIGTSLRTTASSVNNGRIYTNQAGTFNGQSNIYVNDGATFKVSSTKEDARYGTLFTYNTNVYSYKPNIFDMRYYGEGNFFYSWAVSPYSNMYLYDQDIGVWLKDSKGVGNPKSMWQNVATMSLLTFNVGANGARNVTSSDPTLNANTFTINEYSRISNDVALPMIVPAPEFTDSNNKVILNNGDSSFNGSTNYYLPNKELTNKPAKDATLTFKLAGKTYTTQTDDEGNWSFSDLDLKTVKGGTIGQLSLVDSDKRTSPILDVEIQDTVPPTVTPKLIKVELNDTTALQDPLLGIDIHTDETTSSDKLVSKFITSESDRKMMVSELGVYYVSIAVSDEAGNMTTIESPVITYPPGEVITDGYVTGNNVTIDYTTWDNSSMDEKRDILLSSEYGNIQGYSIDGNTVTNVTNDTSKLNIDIPNITWEVNKTYDIPISVNSYTKVLTVTLTPSKVNMNIKQVYTDTDLPIYNDLESKSTIKELSQMVDIGDNIENILSELITNNELTLNHEGYDNLMIEDYNVYQNGELISPKPMEVPNTDFTIVYSYTGQLKFKDYAKDLDFGTIQISNDKTLTSLNSDDSKLSIINTEQNKDWKLKSSIQNEITNTISSKPFLGDILYIDLDGTQHILTNDSIVIDQQKDEQLLSYVNLKANKSGLFMQQHVGNLRGTYTGTILWTLEDTPTP